MVRVGPYTVLEKLGEGAYGNVYKARNLINDEIVALKLTPLQVRPGEGVPATTIREISIMDEVQHENIVRFLGVQINGIGLFMVFEYMNMDLRKFTMMYPHHSRNLGVIKRFLNQMLRGINYCHSNGVIHRDLKPQNLLVNCDTHTVKLADFGLSTRVVPSTGFALETAGTTAKMVPLAYRAPELLLRSGIYSTAVDMWSIGCIFAEMVNQRVLFTGTTETAQLFETFRILGAPTEEVMHGVTSFSVFQNFPETDPQDLAFQVPSLDPDGLDLLCKMLCLDPYKRIDARRALAHQYFTNDGYVP